MKIFLIIGLLIISSIWFTLYSSSDSSNDTTRAQAQMSESSESVPDIDTTSLTTTINQLTSNNPDLAISVSITDLRTGKSYQYGDSDTFIAASTTKLITAVAILDRVEAGELTLDSYIAGTSVREQLQQLIEVSNNEVWANLKAYIGTTELNHYAGEIGLTTYDSATNTITSSDMALLLSKLYEGELLNATYTELLLSYMEQADMDQYIPAAVPSGLTTYHKAGYLEDRLHDTVIIEDDDRAFVLVVFTKGTAPYDFVNGTDILHQITSAGVNTFLPADDQSTP